MSVRYFTSDLHLGHRFVAGLRGFGTVEDHDSWIQDMWNESVKRNDHVIILGDLCVGTPGRALEIVKSLPGRKTLILGNHDSAHPMHRESQRYMRKMFDVFHHVSTAARIRLPDADTDVLLSHFPYVSLDGEADRGHVRHAQWRLPDRGLPLMHGHTHLKEQTLHGRQLHVGVDAWQRFVTEYKAAELIDLSMGFNMTNEGEPT